MDNPPLYLYHALTRLRYKDGFYPILDFKRFYSLISVKHFGLEQINPTLAKASEEVSVTANKRSEPYFLIFFLFKAVLGEISSLFNYFAQMHIV